MFALEYSGQFKKDLKLMIKRGANVEDIRIVLRSLENEGQVPDTYKPHVLSGNFKGIWECHIKPDWLLLYSISDTIKLVRLIRTGSHSDILKK